MKTIGVYVGSFNPFHIGHQNIVKKAKHIFDEVVIGQGWNRDKPKPDAFYEAVGFERRLEGCRYFKYEGLTTDFLRQFETDGAHVVLIRGTRSGYDYDKEIVSLRVMEDLRGGSKIPIVFIPCDREFDHVSSSMVRSLKAIQPSLALKYLP